MGLLLRVSDIEDGSSEWPPMADSGQAILTTGNRYPKECITETNLAVMVVRRTGKAAGRGGAAKSKEWYGLLSLLVDVASG